MKRTSLHRNIHKTANGHYAINKSINNKLVHFATLHTLAEAIEYRDRLIENNWQPLPPPEHVHIGEYYKYVRKHNGRYYSIFNFKEEFLGLTKSIEEALWFRDQYHDLPRDKVPNIRTLDLKTGNPYYQEGLEYPLPDRLVLSERQSDYGSGTIKQKGPASFHIHHGGKYKGHKDYVCACPTIEMAEYVRTEMNKVDWDRTQLQRILDDYPRYYTKLLFFYQYINRNMLNGKQHGWQLVFPKEYTDNKLDAIVYHDIRIALYERDFLKEHDWDYDLLVECIDDNANPYFDMELPTYPTRKIRNIKERNYHEKELAEAIEYVKQGMSRQETADMLGVTDATVNGWLTKFWNSSWTEFKQLVLAGENPLEILEKQEKIYQPDLSRPMPSNYNNHVSYLQRLKRWQVRKGNVTYGVYPTEELAHKISNDLKKVNWDKSKLKEIQARHGHKSIVNSKRWVYRNGNGYMVRRKDKNGKGVYYGYWQDKRIANLVRDMLLMYGFRIENRDWIVEVAEWTVHMLDVLPYTMFGQSTIEDIAYLENDHVPTYCKQVSDSKYAVQKTINGTTEYYGTYTIDKAEEIIEFLQDNNWDKNLLETMQAIGEI